MQSSLFDITDKVALITGSSRGLGFALAAGLGGAGARIVLNGRNEAALRQSVETLTGGGMKAFGYPFDVLDAARVAAQVERIEADIGPIDILVNNAGVQKRGPLEEMEESTWREVLDTNLTAVFLVSRCVVKGMIARRAGKIVNICSLQSEVVRPGIGPYAASKGGLKMLTRSMAAEWARHNIQVNGIGPGYFKTEMTSALVSDAEFSRWVRDRTPAGRWGEPEELIGTAILLCSRASSFINGQIIYVDGGMLTRL